MKWHKIEDGLPCPMTDVLVLRRRRKEDNPTAFVEYYRAGNWSGSRERWLSFGEIIAWAEIHYPEEPQ